MGSVATYATASTRGEAERARVAAALKAHLERKCELAGTYSSHRGHKLTFTHEELQALKARCGKAASIRPPRHVPFRLIAPTAPREVSTESTALSQVQACLNKVSQDNYMATARDLQACSIPTYATLQSIVGLLFDNALANLVYQPLFARLVVDLGQRCSAQWAAHFCGLQFWEEAESPSGAGWYYSTSIAPQPCGGCSPTVRCPTCWGGWVGPHDTQAAACSALEKRVSLKQGGAAGGRHAQDQVQHELHCAAVPCASRAGGGHWCRRCRCRCCCSRCCPACKGARASAWAL
jgi:hypothetical protein